jgi:hypothetical protein
MECHGQDVTANDITSKHVAASLRHSTVMEGKPRIGLLMIFAHCKDAHRLITIMIVVVLQVMTRFKLGTIVWTIDEAYSQHHMCALIYVLKAEDAQTPSHCNLSYVGTETRMHRYPVFYRSKAGMHRHPASLGLHQLR